ncbi:hypothetical protein HK405_001993, partial [Cladochytrium tenue]
MEFAGTAPTPPVPLGAHHITGSNSSNADSGNGIHTASGRWSRKFRATNDAGDEYDEAHGPDERQRRQQDLVRQRPIQLRRMLRVALMPVTLAGDDRDGGLWDTEGVEAGGVSGIGGDILMPLARVITVTAGGTGHSIGAGNGAFDRQRDGNEEER